MEIPPTATTTSTETNDQYTTRRARSGSAGSSHHKRTLSGSLLSKLSFLRMNQAPEDEGPLSKQRPPTDLHAGKQNTSDDIGDGGPRPGTGRAMATAIQQRKMRRRRGSLRKTALLGTRWDQKEKRSNSARSEEGHIDGAKAQETPHFKPTPSTDDEPTPRGSIENNQASTTLSYWPRSLITMKGTTSTVLAATAHQQSLSPTTRTSLVSDTTDDEDDMSISQFNNDSPVTNVRPPSVQSSSGSGIPQLIATPSSSSESYFALHRQPTASVADSMALEVARNSSLRTRSPLATHSPIEMATHHAGVEVGWDYSETEWWGWIILIVTWLVFAVGMGSSFEVWSWAWDVGETPYAPPELEDDPTLPIVGYYPALMVLTAIMAWVWVVVAWVGMKYFKHANISGDDG